MTLFYVKKWAFKSVICWLMIVFSSIASNLYSWTNSMVKTISKRMILVKRRVAKNGIQNMVVNAFSKANKRWAASRKNWLILWNKSLLEAQIKVKRMFRKSKNTLKSSLFSTHKMKKSVILLKVSLSGSNLCHNLKIDVFRENK